MLLNPEANTQQFPFYFFFIFNYIPHPGAYKTTCELF